MRDEGREEKEANATVCTEWRITTHLSQQRQSLPIAQLLVLLLYLLLLLLSSEDLTKDLVECREEVLRGCEWD